MRIICRIQAGKRPNNTTNKNFIDIPVILSDDFDTQPMACLGEIIYNR